MQKIRQKKRFLDYEESNVKGADSNMKFGNSLDDFESYLRYSHDKE
jgi:hypothetical protein